MSGILPILHALVEKLPTQNQIEPLSGGNMRLLLFIFISIFVVNLAIGGQGIPSKIGSLEGSVRDCATHHPLPGVNVILLGTKMGAATDRRGNFLIKDVPIGVYQVRASMIGYEAEIKTGIVVTTGRVTTASFGLSQTILELADAIEVTTGYFEKDEEKPVSSKKLTPREIRSSAGSAEDIFRIIQSMPGVGSAGGKSANLIVRGGSPDENRTLLDNIEIYSPLHFARQGASMGIISIINPSLLEGVEFLTGGFPARYGDKISSVFEMQLKEGNRTALNTDCNLNLGGLGVFLDGPLPGDGNMVLSARRGFFDLLTSMMNKPVAPRYWDLVGKATYDLGVNHKLSLVGFYYLDDVEKTGDAADAGSEMGRKYEYVKRDDYGSAIGVNWRYLLDMHGYMLTTAAFTSNGWKSWAGTELDRNLDGEDVRETEIHLKNEIVRRISHSVEAKAGVFWKSINSDHFTWRGADTTRTGFTFLPDTVAYHPSCTFKAGSFLQGTMRPFPLFSFHIGARYDYFDLTGESKFSPRLGMTYSLTDKTTLNAAYGHFYQTPAAWQVALDTANIALRSSYATHYIAGIERLLDHDTKASIEVYHKDFENTFVDNDTSRVLTNNGTGHARGIEFYVQKKMSGNLVGSLAYTYSISKRRDDEMLPEYSFEFDRPHNVTLLAGYSLSDQWQLGAKFQYASGSPFTPVMDTVQKNGEWYVVEGTKNSARYPDYHRLDIRVDRRFSFGNWTLTAYLDLWNAYARDNVLSYRYDAQEDGSLTKETTYDFPIFPIIGISAQF